MPIRATLGGILAGAQEWSIGFSLALAGTPGVPTSAQMNTLANQIFDAFVSSAWSTTATGAVALRSYASSNATLAECRTYYRGGTSGPAIAVGASTRTAVPGTGTPNVPPQVAIVASLLTDRAGRSGRGRVYLPCQTLSMSVNGNFGSGQSSPLATSVANFLVVLGGLQIASNTLTPSVESSTVGLTPIRSVAVDNIADTQRRRRDKITPTSRAVVPLIAP